MNGKRVYSCFTCKFGSAAIFCVFISRFLVGM